MELREQSSHLLREYRATNTHAEPGAVEPSSIPKNALHLACGALLTIIVLILASIFSTLAAVQQASASSTILKKGQSDPRDCGHNATTAMAAGCVYDIMMVGWTSPECFDAKVSQDALSNSSKLAPVGGAGTFEWATDKHFTDLVPQTPELGKHEWLFAHYGFHRAHCAYVWRVLVDALERREKGEEDVFVYKQALRYEHAVHCSKVLIERERNLEAPTMLEVSGVNKCVRLP
ncbi:hypothetical protein B0J12DRAFT_782449 [Macrophomina phaseolina]|uniref:Uncharacterized protein n=1 Tax=Macrophomina phaseolina TaxID=35725 RepID=A0ABQ8GPA2_9PEZI|nr:hypothetical protein B0J12DRAFT_782449 [Macrophomina phaseolina]